jgi:N-acyl-D-amino-acid deacylase
MPLRNAWAQADATPAASPVAPADIPVSGEAVPELAAIETFITDLMSKWSLPGGQLAIARDNRLVYNRGFGYASIEDAQVVELETTFRIASNSKPITTVAILQLVQDGKLALDTPVFPLLALEGPANAPRDPRLDTITIEQLLVHSGGWNGETGIEPQYVPWTMMASLLLDAEVPAEAETIVRYALSQPLDFDPGTASAYSNFGFNVLGRVIEHVSGQPYDEYALEHILTPSGITTMAIGGTTLEERLEGEARYYAPPGQLPLGSVFPGVGFVPAAYGSFYLRSMDAHGGWIASAEDLVRFTLAVDGTLGTALLTPESVLAMETTQRPPSAAAGAGNVEGGFGLGWNSVASDDGFEWSHAGALIGSSGAWMVRKPNGITAAYVFNSLPEDIGAFFGESIGGLQQLLEETSVWPETDQFA